MTRYAAAVAGLTVLYALALASFAPLDLLFGTILSAVLVFVSRRFVFGGRPDEEVPLLRRVVAFVPFALVVFWQVVQGTWEVALITLHLRPLERPGIVEVPIGERTPAGMTVWAVIVGLTPGSYFVDVDRERGVALIHIINASDPAVFRLQQEDFYNRYHRKVFP
jgi:multisubunit Na+/H+ antiporter MnhE subunit